MGEPTQSVVVSRGRGWGWGWGWGWGSAVVIRGLYNRNKHKEREEGQGNRSREERRGGAGAEARGPVQLVNSRERRRKQQQTQNEPNRSIVIARRSSVFFNASPIAQFPSGCPSLCTQPCINSTGHTSRSSFVVLVVVPRSSLRLLSDWK